MSTVFSDSMDQHGRVEGLVGGWPEVQFTYRLAKDYWVLQYDRISFIPPDRGQEASDLITALLKAHIIDVAAIGPSKIPERVEVDATNLNMIPGPIRIIMCEYIIGRRVPFTGSLGALLPN